MNGQPETHRARSERVPKVAASVPMELGCVALPGCMGSRSWKLSEPRAFGISRSFLPQARSGVNSTPSPLPSLQDGAGAEGSTLLSTLGLSGDSPHPGAASAEPEMLLVPLSLRIYKVSGALCRDRYTFLITSRLPQGPGKGLPREQGWVAVPRAGQCGPGVDGVCAHVRAGGRAGCPSGSSRGPVWGASVCLLSCSCTSEPPLALAQQRGQAWALPRPLPPGQGPRHPWLWAGGPVFSEGAPVGPAAGGGAGLRSRAKSGWR